MTAPKNNNVKVLVAAHRPYWMPSDQMYLPVHAGAALADEAIPGFQSDCEGDNISVDNPRYCELTALYWAWKNLPVAESDYLGLAHYRRHFAGTGERRTLTVGETTSILADAPAILTKARDYKIESIWSHYAHTFSEEQLISLRDGLAEESPRSLQSFDKLMKGTRMHAFNMFVMCRELADEYCAWLFDVLRSAEKYIDFEGLDAFQARCMGRLGERLLDVWISDHEIHYVELPVVNMERVNWAKKGGAFLAAKFLGRKYTGSF